MAGLTEPARGVELYNRPTVDGMAGLTSQEFEKFDAHG